MAQQFATTPETIYNVLANDSIFLGYLGIYTFIDGTQIDSIAILTPGAKLPTLQSQVGLECIIHDSGDVRRKDYMVGDVDLMTTWKIFLVVWDPATGTQLDAAVKRIMHLFGGATSIETVAVTQGLGARVQTMIMVPEQGGLHADAVAILDGL